MRIPLLVLAGILLLPVPCAADSVPQTPCAISNAEHERILGLSFAEFDQTEDDGWRPYYLAKCYVIAADLLVTYVERHPDLVRENYILPFHAGQMLAMAGDYDNATLYLQRGYSSRESKLVDWNAFVEAHLAFIEKDAERLAAMRLRIDKQPAMVDGPGVPDWAVGKKINLDVVDGFLACFDKPFAVAYEEPCRSK